MPLSTSRVATCHPKRLAQMYRDGQRCDSTQRPGQRIGNAGRTLAADLSTVRVDLQYLDFLGDWHKHKVSSSRARDDIRQQRVR
jgi:hypothetical protein